MSTTPVDLTPSEVAQVNARLERWLSDRVGTPMIAEATKPANAAVVEACRGLLSFGDPDDPYPTLSRGDPLSQIARLPLVWSNVLLQCLVGEQPYHAVGAHIDFLSRLVNCGDRPVEIIAGVRTDQKLHPETSRPTDDWNKVAVPLVLAPGEAVELDAERAVLVLWRHGYAAKRAGLISRTNPNPAEQTIREAGYSASWRGTGGGGRTSVDSAEWQRSQAEEAYAAALELRKAKQAADAIARLRTVQPWWPRPDGFDELLEELQKRS